MPCNWWDTYRFFPYHGLRITWFMHGLSPSAAPNVLWRSRNLIGSLNLSFFFFNRPHLLKSSLVKLQQILMSTPPLHASVTIRPPLSHFSGVARVNEGTMVSWGTHRVKGWDGRGSYHPLSCLLSSLCLFSFFLFSLFLSLCLSPYFSHISTRGGGAKVHTHKRISQ